MICRIMFNTAFIQNGNYICAGKMQLSPEDIRKSSVLSKEFKVYIFFDDYCLDCSSYRTEISELCAKCKEGLGAQVLQQWQEVKSITDQHCFPTLKQGRELLHSVPQSRLDLLLKTQLQFNPNYYRIVDLQKLSEEEEKDDQQYGIDARGADVPIRKDTQPKLEFPVRGQGFSNELLQHTEQHTQQDSSRA